MTTSLVAPSNGGAPAVMPIAEGVQRVLEQAINIQRCMQLTMVENVHYGVIPGTKQPSLYQPGADKIMLTFWLRPTFEVTQRIVVEGMIMYEVRCRVLHRTTGLEWGEGVGAANSREARYQNQALARVCPKCGRAAIIKGKAEYGGGYVCYRKKDGCGAQFKDDDEAIEKQAGVVSADKVWDLQNTLYKMACKRAKVHAVINATAASDCFSQDLEDLEEGLAEPTPAPGQSGAKPAKRREGAKPPESDVPISGPAPGSPPANGAPKINQKQVKRLLIALDKTLPRLGGEKEDEYRDRRMAWLRTTVKRENIASTMDLTESEATACISVAEGVPPGESGTLL